jgi:hypothetical protein
VKVRPIARDRATIRRSLSARCCSRATTGHAIAVLPTVSGLSGDKIYFEKAAQVSRFRPDQCAGRAPLFAIVTTPAICPMLAAMTKDKNRGKKPTAAEEQIVPRDPASISFVRGLMARGEAAKADAQGRLPSGATHEIVGETADGLPIVVRRRFSAH